MIIEDYEIPNYYVWHRVVNYKEHLLEGRFQSMFYVVLCINEFYVKNMLYIQSYYGYFTTQND